MKEPVSNSVVPKVGSYMTITFFRMLNITAGTILISYQSLGSFSSLPRA